jgi:hypothetical protein
MVRKIGITEFFLLHAQSISDGQELSDEEKSRFKALREDGVFDKCARLIQHKKEQGIELTSPQQVFLDANPEACRPRLELVA